MRHPKSKICKMFEVFGKCKFDNCAYLHVDNTDNNKVEVLENEVMELKLELRQISKKVKDGNTNKLEGLENHVKLLQDEVKMLADNLKKTHLIIQLMEKDKVTSEDLAGGDKDVLRCTLCEYECKKVSNS